MRLMPNASKGRPAGFIRTPAIAAALLGMCALLVFPAMRAHHFNTSLRTSPALSRIQRHIFVAQPQAAPALVQAAASFTRLSLPDPGSINIPAGRVDLGAYVPLPRLLSRLRIGSLSAPDPLL